MRDTEATIHPQIARVIGAAGHTDTIVVADAGLPIPAGPERIDLAYRAGQPPFLDVLDTICAELVIERVTIAEETAQRSPELDRALRERFAHVAIERIPHEDLKERSAQALAIVRTGEYTPFANVILHAGVPF